MTFTHLIVRHPHVILIAVAVFSGTCLIIPLTLKKLPNFSDPQLGFETRGTVLAQRLTAWENLQKATRASGQFAVNPKDILLSSVNNDETKLQKKQPKKSKVKKSQINSSPEDFETRGTVLAEGLTAWKNLQKATRASGQFAVNPKNILVSSVNNNQTKLKKKQPKKRKVKKSQINSSPEVFIVAKQNNYSEDASKSSNWKTLQELRKIDIIKNREHNHKHVSKDGFFCGTPDERYSRVVLSTSGEKNLFSYESLVAMCYIEHQLTQVKTYNSLCDIITKKQCCHSWSLANYIALLHNRTSCLAITEEDVNSTLALLQSCSPFYHNLYLTHDCSENEECQIPTECGEHNAVYNMLHYLIDTDFLPPNGTSQTFLRQSIIFLPIACSTKTIDYYHNLERKNLNYENVRVVAMDFGLKNTLFDEYLIRDAWLIGLGGVCVLFCMWLYTESVFLTFMTIIAIVFSLAISYFMYTLVFELQFFPFMNLLATVVAIVQLNMQILFLFTDIVKAMLFVRPEDTNVDKQIDVSLLIEYLVAHFTDYETPEHILSIYCIGADDAFIFCKVWQSHKIEKKSSVMRMVTETFQHAILSMFVTSLTTAAAFYASLISSITAVRCFSVFAGTAVIANFGLMVTWLPACLVVSERWYYSPLMSPQWKTWESKLRLLRQTVDHLSAFLHNYLLTLALKFRYIWFVKLSLIAVASVFIVLRYPGLQLPNFPEFQLFESTHPFEQYDLFYKQKFWFERLQKTDSSITANYKLPLRFVWGVLPSDNGDYMDPFSKGSLELDPTFDIAAPESQAWLQHFCGELRTQPFYLSTLGALLPNCFIQSFISWMQRRCIDPVDHIDRSPCCEAERFPYKRDVFQTCIVHAMSDLYETPAEYFMPGVAGPKFSRDQFPLIQAVVVEYDSNYSYSVSYSYMDKFFNEVENWTQEQLKSAPVGMKNGWFISELEFYDLQRVLSESTILAIGVAMCISFVVLLFVTLNILISVFAIISISCSIFSTMAVLVLLGWKLNVLESIAVSTAIGLAVDFSLHYGVNYRMFSADNDRLSATRSALSNMAGPTAMAALTTGMAGALMLPSSVLAYIQIGIFLIVVMSVSWVYSTFLFGAMLSIAGPEHGFGQFKYPFTKQCREHPDFETDTYSADTRASRTSKSVCNNMLSETTLSTTSTVYVIPNSESHELESLTSKGTVPTRPNALARNLHRSNSAGRTSTCNKYFPTDQSPSATSDITIIMTEDN